MTAKQEIKMAKLTSDAHGIIGGVLFAPDDFESFCEALCRDFNGFMIDKYAEDPTQIPMIDDVIDEFLKEKL